MDIYVIRTQGFDIITPKVKWAKSEPPTGPQR